MSEKPLTASGSWIMERNPNTRKKKSKKKKKKKKKNTGSQPGSQPGSQNGKTKKYAPDIVIDAAKGLQKRRSNKKLYFLFMCERNKIVNARTGCMILHYIDPSDPPNESRILMHLEGGHLEVPGGKVEQVDTNIQDTAFREFWEEVVMKHPVTKIDPHCNWQKIKDEMREDKTQLGRLFRNIETRLVAPNSSSCRCCNLSTVYFDIPVHYALACELIRDYGMISFPSSLLKTARDRNLQMRKMYRTIPALESSNMAPAFQRFRNSDTAFHVNGEIYYVGHREFTKMPKALTHLRI